jgi:hypothetical protein
VRSMPAEGGLGNISASAYTVSRGYNIALYYGYEVSCVFLPRCHRGFFIRVVGSGGNFAR